MGTLARGWLRTRTVVRWRGLAPIGAAVYRFAQRWLSAWPLVVVPGRRRAPATVERRIGYYHHAFPTLSETFIRREVAALLDAGVPLDVISHEARDIDLLDEQARRLMASTHYEPLVALQSRPARASRFLRRHPFTLLNLFLYVVCRAHRVRKTYRTDRILFRRAVALAGVLEDRVITHVHSPWATEDALVAMLAARLLRIPYTVHARASDIHRLSSAPGVAEKLRHAAFVVTNTRYNESVLRRQLAPADAAKIHVIFNGIDLERFRPPPARPPHPGPPRILCVARLVEPKGLEFLLQACRMLRDAAYPVRCDIVGGRVTQEINYYIDVARLHRALDLEDDVTFVGAQSFGAVLERYYQADLFVLPAVQSCDGRRDITPNVILEAMAMRLPVVSTHSGAIPELVEDGVTGLLVAPRDAAALATAIRQLLDDPERRAAMGERGRQRVRERFNVETNIRAYVRLFGGSTGPPE